ncbi:MAG: sugar ABC transporter permease, partial [Ruminococcaceae bacterium]|nr:sugar ABC transporter permease [Oscillospiraceae bacterium]
MSDTNTAAIKQAKARRRRYKAEKEPEIKVKVTKKELKKQRELIWLTVPFIIYGIIFYYAPMFGWIMAFQNFKPAKGLLGSDWVGLKHFERLFTNDTFLNVIRNTLAMGVINLVLSFVFAILFAILLNEVRLAAPKKLAQTISYLPPFLSWIIVCGIVRDMLSMDSGIINDLLVRFGILERPINFFAE